MLVKPAENCTKDLLNIGPQLEKDSHVLSKTINNVCPDMDYLKITPLENVSLETERDPGDFDNSNILNRMTYTGLKQGQNQSLY